MAEETNSNKGPVFSCKDVEEWKDHFKKEKNTQKLVVVEFTATWCGPCLKIAPTLKTEAEKRTDALFLEVDVDHLRAVADEYKVEEMPTFVFFKNGKEVGSRVEGALPKDLKEALKNV